MSIPSIERRPTIIDNSLVIPIDSNRRQPEVARQDGELDLRGLFAAMDDVMIVVDRDGTNLKIISINASGLAYTQEEITDKSLSDLFPASQVELFLSCNHQALLTGQTQICEYSLLIGNTERWFQGKCSPLTAETVLWVARDITERKLAEAQLAKQSILHEQTTLALRESEVRWQFALEGAGDGIWDWNIQTDTVFFSRQWKVMLGYAEQEVGNTMSEWDLRVHPDDQAECHALLNKHFAGETATYQAEHRLCCKDGSYKWILARGKIIEWTADHRPLRIIGTHTDIHERKQAESALQNLIKGTAATTGEDFFPAMVKHITAALNVSYALVSELAGGDLRVLAFSANGELQPTFAFDYINTPCERAWRDGLFYCERFVQERFPNHLDLVKMEAQSYLGVALRDSHGQPIGNLCILDQQPIQDIERVENLLNVFAARAGAELEREQATTALEQLNRELEDKVTARTAELKSSQTKFRRLTENVPGMIYRYVLHSDGTDEFTYVSPQVRDIYELEPEAVTQDATVLWSRIHPDDIDFLKAETIASVQDLKPCSIEHRIVTPSSGLKWLQLNARPEQQDNGDIIWDGVAIDITDRKLTEQNTRQQTERETLLRVITQRIRQSLDINTIFDTACAEIREVLQADRVGIFKFYPDSDFDDGEFVAESVVAEFPSVMSIRVHDHCFGNNYSDLYAKGRFYVSNDIYQNGHTSCHTNILAQFAIRANLVMPLTCGDRLWGLLCIHQCATTRHWQQSEIDFSLQISNQIVIAIQQTDLVKQLQTELSERQQAQQLLTAQNEELARATRLKDEFLANMSHELRTPLNAILGLTEGLQEEIFGSVTPTQLKHLQTIERSGSHLLALINDILDVAKIESGQIELDYTATDISALCNSSMAFIKQQALKKRIQLETKISNNLPELSVDERRIRQVLINLLNNAVKFTPEGGRITLQVSHHQESIVDSSQLQGITRINIYPTQTDLKLDLDRHKEQMKVREYLKIAIIDTGIGIAPKHIHRLFQPFIQIDSALNRQYQGTGLGLALVKRIVELHGGQVGLTSEVGRGSCFWVELPYTTPDRSSPELATLSIPTLELEQSNLSPQPQNTSGLILLAEDNEANIMTISSYLEIKGYRLLIAKNGQEAIDLAQSTRPDLILMDIQMPGMDGLEAMQQIRRNPDLVDVPIIALTALAMNDDKERCLSAGANEYISKPIKLKQLATMIQQYLGLGANER